MKVIDLGQADDPKVPWSVREQSIRDDSKSRLQRNAFSAPDGTLAWIYRLDSGSSSISMPEGGVNRIAAFAKHVGGGFGRSPMACGDGELGVS